MTLEQIKNRQEQINGLLYTLLNDTMIVVERIIGGQPKEDSDGIRETPSGLLEEITYSQNITESYIQKLALYNQLLCEKTFSPLGIIDTIENKTTL